MKIAQSLGECPYCGDELVIIKTSTMNRLAKCLNDNCPKKFTYPLPKRGLIEITGSMCPKTQVPVIIIIPQLRVNTGRIKAENEKSYCWAQGPCFSCKEFRRCPINLDLLDEYGGSIERVKGVVQKV